MTTEELEPTWPWMCFPEIIDLIATGQHKLPRLITVDLEAYMRGDVATVLATSHQTAVRWAVAISPHADGSILTLLSRDSDISVRKAVGKHPNCPPEIRDQLQDDLRAW